MSGCSLAYVCVAKLRIYIGMLNSIHKVSLKSVVKKMEKKIESHLCNKFFFFHK